MTADEYADILGLNQRRFQSLVASLRNRLPRNRRKIRTWDRGPVDPLPLVTTRQNDGRYEYRLAESVDEMEGSHRSGPVVSGRCCPGSRSMLERFYADYPEDRAVSAVRRHVRNALEELDEVMLDH